MYMKKYYIDFAVVIFAFVLAMANASCDPTGIAKTNSNSSAPIQKDSTEIGGNAPSDEPQTLDVAGKYSYKTHREGKGGFENFLEVTNKSKTAIHVSFNGTYFYMAGREETFHEGDGEGDAILKGNTSIVTFSGDGGTCKVTLVFEANQVAAKSSGNCGLNVDPNGVYKKEAAEKKAANLRGNTGANTVCPDPAAPCKGVTLPFAKYDMQFHLPAKLKPNVNYKSEPFYAVILKTYDEIECNDEDISTSVEKERIGFQKDFQGRKVFATYECPNMDGISYEFPGAVDAKGNALITTFIAVYAGKSESEAKDFLIYVQTIYNNVQLKRMTASYEEIEQ
jgi:hypothetical protein